MMCQCVTFLIKIERSLRKIREVITRPNYFWHLTNYDSSKDYTPNPNLICFSVGSGLIIYEPKNAHCVEMFTAIESDDLPEKPIQGLLEQWNYLADLGFNTVHAVVSDDHIRSKVMCRAAGMEKKNFEHTNIYKKVIYG